MKDLKERIQGSIFPVKLFVVYVLWLTFITGLIDGPIACLFELGSPHPEDVAESFAMMLALSPTLVAVVFLAIWNFRLMPIFATGSVGFSLWLAWVIWNAYWPGFDTDFPNYFDMLGLLSAALVFALPFIITFAVWLLWNRRKQSPQKMSLA